MKRFLISMFILAVALVSLHAAIYYGGVYIDLRPDAPVRADVTVRGGQIQVRAGDGSFTPLYIQGVDVTSSLPDHFPSDYAVDEETYLRWFTLLRGMGANTLRVYTIMDDSFYNALYTFNSSQTQPLYLLQGLWVSDYANDSSQDAYGDLFYSVLRKDALDAVDVVHGRKSLPLSRLRGSGSYRRDISPWVLGYILGLQWDAGTVAYTDHRIEHPDSYEGRYISTKEGAGAFEAMLAEIMDSSVSYESAKYKTQRLISFISDPQNDPFEYETEAAKQLAKFNRLDMEHLAASKAFQAGLFASYRLYDFCPDFAAYLSQAEKTRLQSILPRLQTGLSFDGYTQLLSGYHSMPVVITGFGFSSARGMESFRGQQGPLTEEQQGGQLVKALRDIKASGCAGAVITQWQDAWGQRTWNTSFAVQATDAQHWHDIQTSGAGYGLLAFEPGQRESVCYVDGDRKEWDGAKPILEADGIRLYAKYDARALYLMASGDPVREEEALYLPIDITPRSGSMVCGQPSLRFEQPADFLVCLAGRQDSRLLVQARYEAMRENYLMEIEGADPFVQFPPADSPSFVAVQMAVLPKEAVKAPEENAASPIQTLYDAYETGKLVYGNGNPDSAQFHSLADFCYGEGFVELRLPWQLLNVSNPADMLVHDDYYLRYGVEPLPITECAAGAGRADTGAPIPMARLPLRGFKSVPYHERLKRSYFIVQDEWRGEDAF